MTSEEAFEKFWEDRQAKGLDAANMREYEESWNAAIAYMQSQSEPVGYLCESPDKVARIFVDKPLAIHSHTNTPIYTTPQRQQPLKRLSASDVEKLNDVFGYFQYGDAQGAKSLAFANAIMNAMQELNK